MGAPSLRWQLQDSVEQRSTRNCIAIVLGRRTHTCLRLEGVFHGGSIGFRSRRKQLSIVQWQCSAPKISGLSCPASMSSNTIYSCMSDITRDLPATMSWITLLSSCSSSGSSCFTTARAMLATPACRDAPDQALLSRVWPGKDMTTAGRGPGLGPGSRTLDSGISKYAQFDMKLLIHHVPTIRNFGAIFIRIFMVFLRVFYGFSTLFYGRLSTLLGQDSARLRLS